MIQRTQVVTSFVFCLVLLFTGCQEDPPQQEAIPTNTIPQAPEPEPLELDDDVTTTEEAKSPEEFFDELSESVEEAETSGGLTQKTAAEREDVFAFDDDNFPVIDKESGELDDPGFADATALLGRNSGNIGGLDGREIPPFVELPPIESEHFTKLYKAWEQRAPFIYRSYSIFEKEKGTKIAEPYMGHRPWNEWKKNFVNVMADMYWIVVHFKRRGNPELGEPDEHFHLKFRFDEKRLIIDRGSFYSGGLQLDQRRKIGHTVIVKHSRAKSSYEMRGFRLPMFLGTSEQVFVPGIDHSGVMVYVPIQKKHGPRGIIFCPRDYDVWKMNSGFAHLEDSKYRVEKVQFELVSLAQSRVLTGFGPGVARVSIQTTPNLAQAVLSEDESTSLYPFVSVKYDPIRDGIQPHPMKDGVITAGAKVVVSLHNSFEHLADSTVYFRTGIQEIPFKKTEQIRLHDRNFRIKPGLCYGLVKEWQILHEFDKKSLPVAVTGASALSEEDESQRPKGIPAAPDPEDIKAEMKNDEFGDGEEEFPEF